MYYSDDSERHADYSAFYACVARPLDCVAYIAG